MPPRRSGRARTAVEREAAAAERETAARSARIEAAAEHAAPALAPLPYALVLLSLLPVDCRLLCAAVCRSWRAALEERSVWLRLDLSASAFSPKRAVTDALLRATAARAHGELVALDVTGCKHVTFDALLAVVAANGGALRELCACSNLGCDDEYRGLGPLNTDALEALLRAAPRLAVVEADVQCHDLALAHRVLRNEAPFAPLRVRSFGFQQTEGELDEAAVLALAADFASYAHLRRLELMEAPLNTAAALDAVVDAALTRRLTSVTLDGCGLSPESAPALVRLVGGGALSELDIYATQVALLDGPAALALGNALRASSTLTAVSLRYVGLWRDIAVATALLGALTGHPSLHSLNISDNDVDPAGQHHAGALIAALVAANAPALTALDVSRCRLVDEGLGPLFDALPANTHLTTLRCTYNHLTDGFSRETLLPAVRANGSLRVLEVAVGIPWACAREAERLVKDRSAS
jgi:hypothetical protein